MGVHAKNIEFVPCPWDAETEPHLALIDGLSDDDISFYRDQVAAGHRRHMAVIVEGERVGSLLWSISDEPGGRVFVLDEMGAHNRRVDLVDASIKMARLVANEVRATTLRFYTRRKGFLRAIPDDFEISYIMEAPA